MLLKEVVYKEQLKIEISDLKSKSMSIRMNRILSLIEVETKEISYDYYQEHLIMPLLSGKAFGGLFECVAYMPDNGKWLVLASGKRQHIYFDALIDVLWYIRTLHQTMEDAFYRKPYTY